MKPNRLKTPKEDAEVVRKFDNLHKRPDTEDWVYWDMIGEVERLRHDCDRSETQSVEKEDTASHLYPRNHKGKDCIYKPLTCQEGICSNCAIYLRLIGELE